MLENYCKVINIEALTMVDMANKDIMPSVSAFIKKLSETVVAKKQALPNVSCGYEEKIIEKASSLLDLWL